MNTERLLRLAAFLEELPPKRFDFDSWVGATWQGKADLSCGTTACAIGWASTMPDMGIPASKAYFERVGVRPLWFDEDGYETSPLAYAVTAFNISRKEADFLFIPRGDSPGPHANATAKEIAAHIRRFVTEGGIY